MKKVIIFFLFISLSVVAQQQHKPDKPLPLDPRIRTGVLPNGMKYFIQKNTKPEKRAELRLAVNAGSTMENDDQQGLAHFVEHMAFNGSKNFKKNELVDYLESIGTKFGADLNAYTSFDETVYMLQIPTDKTDIYKKAFLVLEDWAHNLTFDSAEVEKERGVVMEEWRLGQGAFERMNRKTWPIMFKDSRYAERIPIGKPEILQHCPQIKLRQFYQDFYRPDQQAIIVVGDINIDETEKMIKDQFSKIPPVKNPKPIVSWPVPDQKDLRVAVASDKEAPYNILTLMYAQPPTDLKTENDYRESLKQRLFNDMINARLSELSQKPDAPFMFAGAGFGGFLRNKSAYNCFAMFANGKSLNALEAVITENERVKRHGFSATELERMKKEIMSHEEKAYHEKDKTESKDITGEIVRHFLTGDAVEGIELEYKLTKELLPGVTLEEVNELGRQWITAKGNNAMVTYMMAEKDGNPIPSEDETKKAFEKYESNPNIKAYEDKVIKEPLVARRPKGQKLVKKENKGQGVTEWTLGNGVKILIKPTDFKDDEIIFSAHSWGGTNMYPDKDYLSANESNVLQDHMGYGNYDKIALDKFLADKNVSFHVTVGEIREGMSGGSSIKDFETLLQLIYAAFTMPRKDSSAFISFMQTQKAFIQNASSDPGSVFNDTVQYVMSGYNPRSKPVTEDMLSQIQLDKANSVFKERFSDPSDFVFTFVGSFKPDSILPLLESYLGGISVPQKRETPVDLKWKPAKGNITREVKKGNNPRSTVQLFWTGEFEFTRKNRMESRALTQLMNIKLRENLREEKGGVYGVGMYVSHEQFPKGAFTMIEGFSCAPENVEKLISASLDEINDVKKNGCSAVNLGKIKETLLKERETQLKENGFWLGYIGTLVQFNEPLADIDKYTEWVNSLKGEDFKKWANFYFNDKEFKRFVLNPEK